MSSFLLVTEIHAFKVLPGPHAFALLGVTDLCLDQMGKTQKVGHGSIGQSIKSDLFNANLMNLFLLVIEIHAFKVLPSHMTCKFFNPKGT